MEWWTIQQQRSQYELLFQEPAYALLNDIYAKLNDMDSSTIQREYASYPADNKQLGELLFRTYAGFFSQYCAPYEAGWDKQSIAIKLVWTRTAKAIKYAL